MQARLARATEDPQTRTPAESLVLAYAALVPIVAGAVAVWITTGQVAWVILRGTTIWAGAILCFLAGVRRGLAFRQEGGPTLAQLAAMFWLFALGAGALLSPWPRTALVCLLAGYATVAVLDPLAARRGEAPRYFRRLRPVQMLVPVAAIVSLLARLLA